MQYRAFTSIYLFQLFYLRANHITLREQAESGRKTTIGEIKEIHGNSE